MLFSILLVFADMCRLFYWKTFVVVVSDLAKIYSFVLQIRSSHTFTLHLLFVFGFFLFIFRFLCLVSLSCFSDSVWCLLYRSDDGINGPLIMCFKQHKFTSIMPIMNFLLTCVSFFGFPGNPNRSSPPIKPFNLIIVTSSELSSEVPFSFSWIFEYSKIFFKISSDVKQSVWVWYRRMLMSACGCWFLLRSNQHSHSTPCKLLCIGSHEGRRQRQMREMKDTKFYWNKMNSIKCKR
jgi:hypothetical protein